MFNHKIMLIPQMNYHTVTPVVGKHGCCPEKHPSRMGYHAEFFILGQTVWAQERKSHRKWQSWGPRLHLGNMAGPLDTCWTTSLQRPPPVYSTSTRRAWQLFSLTDFQADLQASVLCDAQSWRGLDGDSLVRLYDDIITQLLDRQAFELAAWLVYKAQHGLWHENSSIVGVRTDICYCIMI